MKLLQEEKVEPNDNQIRINQMIQFQQSREEVYKKTQVIQESIKKIYDRRVKDDDFKLGDMVLKWDLRTDHKRKHGKFENL
jgi:hypothetical protein